MLGNIFSSYFYAKTSLVFTMPVLSALLDKPDNAPFKAY
jgi:hypothetical protein